ncbi:MAG: nitronate monooxygenase, partial [Paeniclostridium sordellii]|nr:nitronate monooxygenase [Paeniclostridium sordellii]
MNRLCEILNIKYPIIQGGMAWVATAELAAGVSNAGGLGLIAAGNAPKEVIKDQIRKCRELTDKTFGVNVMLLSPFADEIIDLVIEEKVEVITTAAGNPAKYM